MTIRSTIFVSIASYRDPECRWTIYELFSRAKLPSRVHVGVYLQVNQQYDNDNVRNVTSLISEDLIPNVRIMCVDSCVARGPCPARCNASSLWKGEDYFFQIDSHMRLLFGWDEFFINELNRCPSPLAVLSTYPPGYEALGDSSERKEDAFYLETRPVVLCADSFDSDKILRLRGRMLSSSSAIPIPSLFWASGCSFSLASVLTTLVQYDSELLDLFFGEEISMTARMWTSGIDLFAPSKTMVYHHWNRDYRPTFRENSPSHSSSDRDLSISRVLCILGMAETSQESLKSCGLGNCRSLHEFQRYVGINFSSLDITDYAVNGGLLERVFVENSFRAPDLSDDRESSILRLISKLPIQLTTRIMTLALNESSNISSSLSSDIAAQSCDIQSYFRIKCLNDIIRIPRDILLDDNVTQIYDKGYTIIDNFIPDSANFGSTFNGIFLECDDLVREGKLKKAGMGRHESYWKNDNARGDYITWLKYDAVSYPCLTNFLLERFRFLYKDLNLLFTFGVSDRPAEIQLGYYPGNGACYVRHRDAFMSSDVLPRIITAVFYPNVDWSTVNGGCLRIYNYHDDSYEDVEPLCNRLVIFLSGVIEHEVLPTFVPRFAVTAWYR